MRTIGERSKPAIPILKVGIVFLIGAKSLSKKLSNTFLSWPIGCSRET